MDEDIVRLTTTAVGALELRLALSEMDDAERVELAQDFEGYEWVHLAGCSLAKTPGKKDSWIENVGGELPEYICEVARGIKRSGKSTSQAIQMAIGTIQRWARGQGEVDSDTRIKAAKAIAQWQALKAKAAKSK